MRKNQVITKLSTILLIISIIFVHLLFSYNYFNGWWYSFLGTNIIILLSYFAWKREFLTITGLNLSLRTLLFSILIMGLVILTSALIISFSKGSEGLLFNTGNWKSYFHQVFYIVNEEIIMGSLPIYFLIKKLNMNKWLVATGIALLFSILHFAFYLWVFDQRGLLKLTTLVTLFLVGFFRNTLIIRNGHIGYSWAFHFGWMSVMFGSFPQYSDGTPLREPESFNLFLGSWSMMIIAMILVLGMSFYYGVNDFYRKKTRNQNLKVLKKC